MSETSPLKIISFVYLVREVGEGNVYIPVKTKIICVRDSCRVIIIEIDRFFLIYFNFFIVPNNGLIILFFSKCIAKF